MKNTQPIKKGDGVYYYNHFPEWIRQLYYETIKGICQGCKKQMTYKEMDIHRVTRKTHGGLYTFCKLNHPKQNCMFLHLPCHQARHSNELNRVSHSY